MTRMLAMLLFAASCAAAFSFSIVGITVATGKPPFGIEPMLAPPPPEPPKPPSADKKYREPEQRAHELYLQLEAERKKMGADTVGIAERANMAMATIESAKRLQVELEASQKKVEKLMLSIDKTEKDNIKKLSKVVEGMDAKAAGKMLLEMLQEKPDLVPKVLANIKPKVTSEVLSTIVNTADKQKLEDAVRMATDLQKVMDDN